MSFESRWYQREAVNAIFEYYTAGNTGNPIEALPTGTGKSVVIAIFVKEALQHYPGTRVLMLTHREELIKQNAAKLVSNWPTAPIGIYSDGVGRKETGRPITFAGIQSVAKKPNLFFPVDIVLIDECHLVSQKETTMYRTFLEQGLALNPYMKVIGFTATPYRHGLGDLTLGGIFTDRCYDLTGKDDFNRLLSEGYLCRLIPKQTNTELSAEGVTIRGGEYSEKELQAAVDRSDITAAAVRELVTLGQDRNHWLLFSSGIKHAEHIADELKRYNISCAVVTGNMKNRDVVLADFMDGKYRAVVNNNVLTTGFDYPEIDLLGILRPTRSASLWVQMLGRGTRPFPGKANCLVLDFARNTQRLGPINDPVLPSMKAKKKDEPGACPVKVCPTCMAYNHTRASICSSCGAEFPPSQNDLRQVASEAQLIAGPPEGPIVEVFDVNQILYSVHRKRDKPPSLRVDYVCCNGFRTFSEYVCVAHEGFAKVNAKRWWQRRTQVEFPSSAEMATTATPYLATPVRIKVHVNLDKPRVIDYEFA
ncbi:MAG: DEAD/DEAH box helicase [Alphaproteobacteria bacterium]|nr:DEAD/DEAH box helicase [Alphaproteobacteria bacterium]